MASASIPAELLDAPPPPWELINGTPGDNRLIGEDVGEWIYCRGGDDTVRANGGDDVIEVGRRDVGPDLIDGGDGIDLLILDRSRSTENLRIDLTDPSRTQRLADGTIIRNVEHLDFIGGGGDDTVAGFGIWNLDGGAGDDSLVGNGAHQMFGGAGDDVIRQNGDRGYLMSGGDGSDTMFASQFGDRLFGDAGKDTLVGGAEGDQLTGGKGDDRIDGGAGNDIIVIDAGDGIDSVHGGDGDDYLSLDRSLSDLDFSFRLDPLTVTTLADGTRFVFVESIAFWGGSGDDKVTGGRRGDYLDGGGGNDTLYAGAGGRGELVFGGDGDDSLIGSGGFDSLYGEAGDDMIATSADGDYVFADEGDDTIMGGDGDDVIDAGLGSDLVSAGGGRDHVSAFDLYFRDDGPDTLDGGAGEDTLSYREAFKGMTVNLRTGTDSTGSTISGFEILLGSFYDDDLTGSNKADVLRGNGGADTLTGGDGGDRFVFGGELFRQLDWDLVRDFSGAEGDRIDLSRIDAIRGGGTDEAFTFIGAAVFTAPGQLRAVQRADGAFSVTGDRDGDGAADFEIVVRSAAPLTADDFVL